MGEADYVRAETLSVTADLKATQIAADIGLYRDLAQSVSTRNEVQVLLKDYRNGNTTAALDIALKVISSLGFVLY